MRIRKDGEATRRRILEAACTVFGEKGYRDATHAEICREAGVNTAAINYHFGSKDALYRAAWDHVTTEADRIYPLHGGVPETAPAEERLRGRVQALLRRRGDRKKLAHLHNLRMMEMVNPTGLLEEAITEWRHKAREFTLEILRGLLGPKASRVDLELCEMSVISQCLMVHKRVRHRPYSFPVDDVEGLVEHVMRFSMAGIRAVRREIQRRES